MRFTSPRRIGAGIGVLVVVGATLAAVPSIGSGAPASLNPASRGSLPSGVTPAAAPGSTGTTVGGVHCAPGVRQVPWSAYSPECVPAYAGHNGGSTSPGVSATEIDVSSRVAASAELSMIYSLIPQDVLGTNDELLHVINAYVDLFNRSFELYGRHVVIKPFVGQGDFISELTGTGQQQAQADAVNAQSLGVFADISGTDTSQVYEVDLAQQHVVSFPEYVNADDFYSGHSPWIWTQGPDCTKADHGIAAVVGRALANQPATFAGDPAIALRTRSFGVVYQDDPYSKVCYEELASDLKAAGVTPRRTASFTFDFSTMTSQFGSIVSGMEQAGVTTVIDVDDDPITPGFLMSSASQLSYHPEWLLHSYIATGDVNPDPMDRRYDPAQLADTIIPGIATPPPQDQESEKVLGLTGHSGDSLPIWSLDIIYQTLLDFFIALQNAGPDLTPQSFASGMQHIASVTGIYGTWNFGPGIYDPSSSFQILHWNPAVVSPEDGKRGTFLPCNGGHVYLFATASTQLARGVPLDCTPSASRSTGG